MGNVEVAIRRHVQPGVALRSVQQWTLRIIRSDGDVMVERRLGGATTKLETDLDPGEYTFELIGRFGGLLARLAAIRVVGEFGAKLLEKRFKQQLPLPGVPFVVDTSTKQVGAGPDGVTSPVTVSLDTTGALTARALRAVYSMIDTALVIVLLALITQLVVNAARWDWSSAVHIVVGSAVAAGGVALAVTAFVSALRAVSPRVRDAGEPRRASPLELIVSLVADLAVGVALVFATASGVAMLLVGLQDHGLQFEGRTDRIGASKLFEGVLWHAADTIPLVDVGTAWNWTEPWKLATGSTAAVFAGAVLLVMRLVVAVGLAQVVAKLVERVTSPRAEVA